MRTASQLCNFGPRHWLFIGLFTLVFRLLVLVPFSNTAFFAPSGEDMKFYHDWALRVVHGHGTDGQAFYGLPGYAFWIGALYALFGVSSWPITLVQCLFDALTSVIVARLAYEVARDLTPGARATAAFLAALGWTTFLPAQTYSVILMPTVIVIAIFWLIVLRFVAVEKEISWKSCVGLGLTIGVTAMGVATVLMLIPLVVVAIWFGQHREAALRRRVTNTLLLSSLLMAGVFAGCSPVWIYNRFVAREPVMLSAHSGVNYWIGNNPEATGYPKIPKDLRAGQEELLRDSVLVAEREAGRKLTRAEVSRYWSEKTERWIRSHRHEWLELMLRKLSNFWNAFQYDDLSMVPQLQAEGVLLPGLRFGVIAALAIPGMLLAVWRVPKSRWIAAAIFLHIAALMPVFITERYRMCAVPGLVVFSSYGLCAMWDRLAARKWLGPLAYGVGTAAAALLVSASRADAGLWSLDHYNRGLRAQKNGDFALAQQELELAYAYVPDNAEINFGLGTFWHERGDRQKAKAFYRHAIQLNPRHANAWNNLGVIAMEEKYWAVARRCFEFATKFEPEDAKSHFLVARAALELGDRAAARAAIDQALRLRPGQPEFEELARKLDTAPQ